MDPLAKPPIIEAVVDIDCDLPSQIQVLTLKDAALAAYGTEYPRLRFRHLDTFQFGGDPAGPSQAAPRRSVQAMQFLAADAKQLVQVRAQGYSFNRLAPYTSLDEYMAEIERTWRLYVDVAAPVQVRLIRLRYINRILLPLAQGGVDLDTYFRVGPRLPDDASLTFLGFVDQHRAVERETNSQVRTVLMNQPQEGDRLPVIFDNTVIREERCEPADWERIADRLAGLRKLKNHVFERTLTPECLRLFQ